MGAGQQLPTEGTAFISVNNHDKPSSRTDCAPSSPSLASSWWRPAARRAYLRAHGLDADILFKVNEGRPHVGDELLNRRIALVINTPLGRESFFDDRAVRSVAMMQGVPASRRSPARRRPSAPSRRSAPKGSRCGRSSKHHAGAALRSPDPVA